MTDADLLSLVLFIWAGVMTGLWIDAKREIRLTKHIMITLVRDKEERKRFFDGFEKVLEGKLND